MKVNKVEARALQKKNFRLMTAIVNGLCIEVKEMNAHLELEEADEHIERLRDKELWLKKVGRKQRKLRRSAKKLMSTPPKVQ